MEKLEIVKDIVIPSITIIISLLGSTLVARKSIIKSKTSEWIERLRISVSDFLAFSEIPDGTLLEYKKKMFAVHLLLDKDVKEQKDLIISIEALSINIMDRYNNPLKASKYPDYMQVVMDQFHVIAKIENHKIHRSFFSR